METIKISGIDRSNDEGTHGFCQELINMRFKDGSWQPVGTKKLLTANGTPANVEKIFVHTVDKDTDIQNEYAGRNFLGYRKDGNIITWEVTSSSNPTVIYNIGTGKADYIRFEAFKNIVIIIDTLSNKHYFLFWKDQTYTFIPSAYPDVLDVTYSIASELQLITKKKVSDNSVAATYEYGMNAYRTDGKEEGCSMIRYAYELYDGSIILPSTPTLINFNAGLDTTQEANMRLNVVPILKHKTNGQPYPCIVFTFPVGIVSFTIANNTKNQAINTLLNSTFKHIIKKVNFYMTAPTPSGDITKLGDVATDNNWHDYDKRYGAEFTDTITKDVYYKVASLDAQDLSLGNSNEVKLGTMYPYSNLEKMPEDAGSHHSRTGAASLVYNGRLILGNVKTTLSDGYNPDIFFKDKSDADTIDPFTLMTFTTLMTDEGKKVVKAEGTTQYTKSALSTTFLITYPDYRATTMVIYGKRVSDGSYFQIASYILTQHPTLNFSFKCFAKDFSEWPFGVMSLGMDVNNVPATNNAISDSNKYIISELNNPFTFPADKAGVIGSSDIIGFATNAIPISQGQYGQYPIFVFTNTGMWAMEVGTNDVVVSSVAPLNDLVCNNPKAITNADRVTIFSTNEGLVILQGTQDTLISIPLRGSNYSSPIIANDDVQTYVNDARLIQLKDSISEVDFETFLENAHFGYDSKRKEIVVSNYTYQYSYVYSIENNLWTKISQRFKYFVNSYPEMLAVGVNNDIIKISEENTDPIDALVITRPIEYPGLTKLIRVGLKATIDTDDSVSKATGMYLYGSVDGRNWHFVTGLQKLGSFNNPYVNYALMSFKFAIIIVAGCLENTSRIRQIDIDAKVKYGNKAIR